MYDAEQSICKGIWLRPAGFHWLKELLYMTWNTSTGEQRTWSSFKITAVVSASVRLIARIMVQHFVIMQYGDGLGLKQHAIN